MGSSYITNNKSGFIMTKVKLPTFKFVQKWDAFTYESDKLSAMGLFRNQEKYSDLINLHQDGLFNKNNHYITWILVLINKLEQIAR